MGHNVKNIVIIHLVVFLFMLFVFFTPTHFTFLIWNVFLALLPLDFALIAAHSKPIFAMLAGILWLLFFPNTMYMITDFIHLQYISTAIDVRYQYFNYSVLAAGIFIGVTLGVLSLEIIIRRFFDPNKDFLKLLFMMALSLISALGIYLGRFLRLNSWDVFTRADFVWQSVQNSLGSHMLTFVVLFAGVQFALLIVYHYGGQLLTNLTLDKLD
ncbi:DUF1361 domain-containing protein [Convivina intestini]|uniref:Putative membrane protein n=1 Tax=Convivina intestini TaxID=1505726 RepID=A0A2U1DC41_9LACO|nr:DUF1361 domain-containing protein [Convivina intestini]PVY85254.1 putative membrane protein [Convivina intestini]CAH1852616.1 hypothetical protein R077811_00472 [Convivina intestini]SDB87136.1 Uncharacterized membrane protein [Leuconostocaceae bacterium R-53105]